MGSTSTAIRPRRLQLALTALAVLLLAAILVDRIFFETSSTTSGTGSGGAATQARSLPPFTGVDLIGANNVVVRVGPRQSVVVHADRNLLGRVTTRVRAGRLAIGTTPGELRARSRMFVAVSVPSLDGLGLEGAGNISATGVDSPRLSVALPGSGNIEVSGTAERLDVAIGGEGTAALRGLIARDARATLAGVGTITLTATRALTARISGSGTILYGGNPEHVDRAVVGDGVIGPG
jgi:hypothetical protein